MKDKPNYWWKAFNARPLGMPVPPNWFGVAAFGLLGALVNPGLWLIGVGLEGMYLWWLAIMLFDLSFIWHRYTRFSVSRRSLHDWRYGTPPEQASRTGPPAPASQAGKPMIPPDVPVQPS
jgi:hypothetical protein